MRCLQHTAPSFPTNSPISTREELQQKESMPNSFLIILGYPKPYRNFFFIYICTAPSGRTCMHVERELATEGCSSHPKHRLQLTNPFKQPPPGQSHTSTNKHDRVPYQLALQHCLQPNKNTNMQQPTIKPYPPSIRHQQQQPTSAAHTQIQAPRNT